MNEVEQIMVQCNGDQMLVSYRVGYGLQLAIVGKSTENLLFETHPELAAVWSNGAWNLDELQALVSECCPDEPETLTDVIKRGDYVVLDTETTGLYADAQSGGLSDDTGRCTGYGGYQPGSEWEWYRCVMTEYEKEINVLFSEARAKARLAEKLYNDAHNPENNATLEDRQKAAQRLEQAKDRIYEVVMTYGECMLFRVD